MSSRNRKTTGSRKTLIVGALALVIAMLAIIFGVRCMSPTSSSSSGVKSALIANKQQLDTIYNQANVRNKDLKVSASDKYLVLSTCREEDPTIRANLYLRQIPDAEMTDFVAKHGKDLEYSPTR